MGVGSPESWCNAHTLSPASRFFVVASLRTEGMLSRRPLRRDSLGHSVWPFRFVACRTVVLLRWTPHFLRASGISTRLGAWASGVSVRLLECLPRNLRRIHKHGDGLRHKRQ